MQQENRTNRLKQIQTTKKMNDENIRKTNKLAENCGKFVPQETKLLETMNQYKKNEEKFKETINKLQDTNRDLLQEVIDLRNALSS